MKLLKKNTQTKFFFLIPYFFIMNPIILHSACLKTVKATLRKGPGVTFQKLWDITLFSPLKVKKYKNDWVQIEDAEGVYAWLHKKDISDKYFCGSVKKEKVPIKLLTKEQKRSAGKKASKKAFAFFDQNFKILEFKKGRVTAISPLGNKVILSRKSLWVQ